MAEKLTNNVGAPVAHNQHVMTAGPRGPMLKNQQGIKNLTDQEAEAIIGKDRESHQRAWASTTT